MIEVQGVSHRFDVKWVLSDVSFEIPAGEIAVVMGSSGGGKTTLLKCISGLLKPTKGEIAVCGVSVVGDPEWARAKMGLVFQYAALFDSLDVEENILFGYRRQHSPDKKAEAELLTKLLGQVGLEGVERQLPSALSGGMRKRVGLARALAMEPEVLLYDEPTSGLDPVTAYSIDQLIVQTRDRLGLTSLVVSHDVNSIFRVADRIIFLHAGEVAFNGTPAEFRREQSGPIGELIGKARSESLT
ncbi:MAG: ATP-binding cassette domain-containing protein [Armatimonadetes bacterium]|nr:ATP-binding cassette domain-containing protein [Armatimonadota bacterium]MBS1711983.1 ATP-binding cassette domain-containing protein [Armatimonadota bacterium]MBX3109463.1 ATP-binding cassette domain-containing protein [Fimbriimonadaceae bacterium]